jgi:hypothetical protein
LQPLVEAEPGLEGQHQLRSVEAHAPAQGIDGGDALRLIGVALVDVFLRHAVERGQNQLRLKRQRLEMRRYRDRQRLDIFRIDVIGRRDP